MHGWRGNCMAQGGVRGSSHAQTPCEQTDTCKNVTFPQLRLQAVKIRNENLKMSRNVQLLLK